MQGYGAGFSNLPPSCSHGGAEGDHAPLFTTLFSSAIVAFYTPPRAPEISRRAQKSIQIPIYISNNNVTRVLVLNVENKKHARDNRFPVNKAE